jgi:hypothetical protein
MLQLIAEHNRLSARLAMLPEDHADGEQTLGDLLVQCEREILQSQIEDLDAAIALLCFAARQSDAGNELKAVEIQVLPAMVAANRAMRFPGVAGRPELERALAFYANKDDGGMMARRILDEAAG